MWWMLKANLVLRYEKRRTWWRRFLKNKCPKAWVTEVGGRSGVDRLTGQENQATRAWYWTKLEFIPTQEPVAHQENAGQSHSCGG